jgi:cytochrome c oxidase subunit 2
MVSDNTRRDLIRLAVLWLVFSVIAEVVMAYLIGHYPGTASRQGVITSDAVVFLLRITVPVFILVVLIVVFSMIRFRVGDDDCEPSEHQYRSGRAFPWGWMAASTVLNVLFIIHPGISGLSSLWSMASAATDPLEVDVTASQWQWRFDYPAQELMNQAELVVPVDMPVRFVLNSADVIHSFWVPAWGIKKAVVPGRTRTLVVTPDQIINTTTDPLARVQCSQICGVGHAEMRAMVRVVSPADFNTWIETARATKGGMPGMNMPGKEMNGPGGTKMAPPKNQMNMGPSTDNEKPAGSAAPPAETGSMFMPTAPTPGPGAQGNDKMPTGGHD